MGAGVRADPGSPNAFFLVWKPQHRPHWMLVARLSDLPIYTASKFTAFILSYHHRLSIHIYFGDLSLNLKY